MKDARQKITLKDANGDVTEYGRLTGATFFDDESGFREIFECEDGGELWLTGDQATRVVSA